MNEEINRPEQKSRFDFSSAFDINFSDYNYDDDTIGAYFKQRTLGQKIPPEYSTDNESSLGVLDVDNLSLLDDNEKFVIEIEELQDSLHLHEGAKKNDKKSESENKKYDDGVFKRPYTPKPKENSDSESYLKKQRELAQKAISKFCNNDKSSSANNSKEIIVIKSPKLNRTPIDVHQPISKIHIWSKDNVCKKWFEQNQTPETPKYFKDELSSIYADDVTVNEDEKNARKSKRVSTSKVLDFNDDISKTDFESVVKQLESPMQDVKLSLAFEPLSTDAVLKKFEEDEHDFIAEADKHALSHNSEISHFSGVGGDDMGQYFKIRSNSITSLVGPVTESEYSFNSSGFDKDLPSSTLSDKKWDDPLKYTEKSKSSLSIYDWKKESEPSLPRRFSNDSCASNNTINIKNLLADLDSGLSGTEIYERLMNMNEKETKAKKSEGKRLSKNADTPKSSRVPAKRTESKIVEKVVNDTSSRRSSAKSPIRFDHKSPERLRHRSPERLQKASPHRFPSPSTTKRTRQASPHRMPQAVPHHHRQASPQRQPQKLFQRITQKSPNNKCLRHSRKSTPKSGRSKKSPESKENSVPCKEHKSKIDQKILTLKNEKVRKLQGFDCSTPKLESNKSSKDRFMAIASNRLVEEENWEPPRISSIQPCTNLNKTGQSGENEHTISLNRSSISSDSNRKNETVVASKTITIEESINSGDLTILSQRINDIKSDSVTQLEATQKESVVLSVVKKLADYPTGTLDCAALTPILKSEYPELLTSDPYLLQAGSDDSFLMEARMTSKDDLHSEPGSWITLPPKNGLSEKINICAEGEKIIDVPVMNASKRWLLVSIQSVNLRHHLGKSLDGAKLNHEWIVDEFLRVSLKDTVVPPGNQQSLRFFVTPRIPALLNIKITLSIKDLLGQETQIREMHLIVTGVNPCDNITVIPEDVINFGAIPEQCIDEKTVIVTYDGVCDLPLEIFAKEQGSYTQQFFLSQDVLLNGDALEGDLWRDGKFCYTLQEGKKSILEFKLLFQSRSLSDTKTTTQVDVKGMFVVAVKVSSAADGTLFTIPISGSIGYSKFLCNPACSPMVLKTNAIGKSIARSFPMKNVGSIPLKFIVKILCEKTKKEQTDDLFTAPKSVYLPKNEETAMNIIFTANTKENYVKRLLTLQLKPNGQVLYDVELVGIVIPTTESRPVSRYSHPSDSTSSVSSSDLIPIKLTTTTHSVSWPAVSLDTEIKQSFHIKNSSNVKATARISFLKDNNAFKIVNEDNEKLQKLRKVLKPDVPQQLTISFRPDAVGPHHNVIVIETNNASSKNMISLNGYGGVPNILIGNTKSDLNGHKMAILSNTSPEQQIFTTSLEFFNHGNVPGFVMITKIRKVLSLSHELITTPANFVVDPNQRVVVHVSQKLKNQDIKTLLSGKDIGNLATLSVVIGDEPSRLRLRKVVEKKDSEPSEFAVSVVQKFENESEINMKRFHDNDTFEKVLVKTLKTVDIAVVVERSTGFAEATILEDNDETVKEFITFCGPIDNTLISPIRSYSQKSHSPGILKINESRASFSSDNSTKPTKKITKWLESIENADCD